MHNRATTFISAPFIRTPDTRLVEVYAALDVFKLSLVRDIEPMIEAYAAHKRRSPTDTIDEHTAKVRGEFHQQLAFINSLVSQVFAGDLKAAVAWADTPLPLELFEGQSPRDLARQGAFDAVVALIVDRLRFAA